MKQLINYIAGRTYESDLADRINAEVKDAIRHDKWRTEYMSYLNAMLDSFEEGEKKGIEKGISGGIKSTTALFSWLFDQGRDEDVKRASVDEAFLDELFKEYNSKKING